MAKLRSALAGAGQGVSDVLGQFLAQMIDDQHAKEQNDLIMQRQAALEAQKQKQADDAASAQAQAAALQEVAKQEGPKIQSGALSERFGFRQENAPARAQNVINRFTNLKNDEVPGQSDPRIIDNALNAANLPTSMGGIEGELPLKFNQDLRPTIQDLMSARTADMNAKAPRFETTQFDPKGLPLKSWLTSKQQGDLGQIQGAPTPTQAGEQKLAEALAGPLSPQYQKADARGEGMKAGARKAAEINAEFSPNAIKKKLDFEQQKFTIELANAGMKEQAIAFKQEAAKIAGLKPDLDRLVKLSDKIHVLHSSIGTEWNASAADSLKNIGSGSQWTAFIGQGVGAAVDMLGVPDVALKISQVRNIPMNVAQQDINEYETFRGSLAQQLANSVFGNKGATSENDRRVVEDRIPPYYDSMELKERKMRSFINTVSKMPQAKIMLGSGATFEQIMAKADELAGQANIANEAAEKTQMPAPIKPQPTISSGQRHQGAANYQPTSMDEIVQNAGKTFRAQPPKAAPVAQPVQSAPVAQPVQSAPVAQPVQSAPARPQPSMTAQPGGPPSQLSSGGNPSEPLWVAIQRAAELYNRQQQTKKPGTRLRSPK